MKNKNEPDRQIDYDVADNATEWMMQNPGDQMAFEDGGPGMEFSYAGGRRSGGKRGGGGRRGPGYGYPLLIENEDIETYDGNEPAGEFSNAGGYGFWVSKAAAAKRDAAKAASAAAVTALSQPDTTAAQLAAINAPIPAADPGASDPGAAGKGAGKGGSKADAPAGMSTGAKVGIAVAILAVAGGGYLMYKKMHKA